MVAIALPVCYDGSFSIESEIVAHSVKGSRDARDTFDTGHLIPRWLVKNLLETREDDLLDGLRAREAETRAARVCRPSQVARGCFPIDSL